MIFRVGDVVRYVGDINAEKSSIEEMCCWISSGYNSGDMGVVINAVDEKRYNVRMVRTYKKLFFEVNYNMHRNSIFYFFELEFTK